MTRSIVTGAVPAIVSAIVPSFIEVEPPAMAPTWSLLTWLVGQSPCNDTQLNEWCKAFEERLVGTTSFDGQSSPSLPLTFLQLAVVVSIVSQHASMPQVQSLRDTMSKISLTYANVNNLVATYSRSYVCTLSYDFESFV